MVKTYRHIAVFPASILAMLARAHFFVSRTETEYHVDYHETLYGEKSAQAIFSCMVWGLDAWREALNATRTKGLPRLTKEELDMLDRKAYFDFEDGSVRAETPTPPAEAVVVKGEEGEDGQEAIEAEYDMPQLHRRLGYNVIWKATEEI